MNKLITRKKQKKTKKLFKDLWINAAESFTITISKTYLGEKCIVNLLISLTKHLKRLALVQKRKED